jgi:NAD(P)-dependent dehydrogenase (short-subunit alcohol dehydrogenase family)
MTDKKVAMIIGGGSGMGADAARKLAADGFDVAILSSSGKGEALAGELDGFGMTGSNQSNDDLQAFTDQTIARYGRIDAVVSSAGHGPKGPVLEISDDDWHKGMDFYLMNVVRIARIVTPTMVAQGGGAFVNISTGIRTTPGAHPHGPLWQCLGGLRSDRVFGIGKIKLHHRPEHPHRRRNHPVSLIRRRSIIAKQDSS